MSTKILEDNDGVCLYDSTKMVAFGPVMGDAQEAEAFLVYLDEKGFPDPKGIGISELNDFWYPHFVPWYKKRLCTECDMFDKDGKCEECAK